MSSACSLRITRRAPGEGSRVLTVGDRVVVRYRLPDGRATDALGLLLEASDTHLVVDGKRGVETIAVDDVITAKSVPPAPVRTTIDGCS